MTKQYRPAEMKQADQPMAERFRLRGREWASAKMKADLCEEMKSAFLESEKTKLITQLMAEGEKAPSEAKLERIVKSSPEWEQYIKGMCHARELADFAWVERKAVEIEESEIVDKNANYRTERRMHERS